jgi:hypothetical protein
LLAIIYKFGGGIDDRILWLSFAQQKYQFNTFVTGDMKKKSIQIHLFVRRGFAHYPFIQRGVSIFNRGNFDHFIFK